MDARSALTGNPPARGEGGRVNKWLFAGFILCG